METLKKGSFLAFTEEEILNLVYERYAKEYTNARISKYGFLLIDPLDEECESGDHDMRERFYEFLEKKFNVNVVGIVTKTHPDQEYPNGYDILILCE